MLLAALAGYVFGFVGSVPVAGPIAVLVLERSLARRYADAEGIALGGALAECVYAGAAFLGLGIVVSRYPAVLVGARALGAVVLYAVAYALYRGGTKVPDARIESPSTTSRARGFSVGFSLTIANPTLIATWSVVSALAFARLPLTVTAASALAFPIGAGLGIASWLMLFVRIIRRGGKSLSERALARVRNAMVFFVLCIATWFAFDLWVAF